MFQETVKEGMQAVRGLSRNDILAALGLERKRSLANVALPAAGLFTVGVLVGGGIAMLLSPKSGREMREKLRYKGSELAERAGEARQQVQSALPFESERPGQKPERGEKPEARSERKGESGSTRTAPQK
jgi:hypothetical protein